MIHGGGWIKMMMMKLVAMYLKVQYCFQHCSAFIIKKKQRTSSFELWGQQTLTCFCVAL